MKKSDGFALLAVALLLASLGYLFFVAETEPSGALGYVPVEVEAAQLLEAYAPSLEAVNVVVDLPVGGFVTVHAAIGDAPGPIVGRSGYLEPGKRMTSMRIDPLMTPGATFIVLVRKDDGDSVYVTENDLPIMVGGEVLRADVTAPVL